MSEWSKIKDVSGWTKKLGELLEAAKEVAKDGALAPRLELNERLLQFVENSWPNNGEIGALDDIALSTATALMRESIEERLLSITQRTGEYHKLGKQFEALAEENRAKAESIRLRSITSFVESSLTVVETAKAIQSTLKDSAADAKLDEQITTMIGVIEDLRTSLGKRL